MASCKSSGMLSCARRWATLRSSCGAFLVGAVAGGHPGEMAIVYWKTWENIEKYGGEYGEIWGAGRWGLETAQLSFSDL